MTLLCYCGFATREKTIMLNLAKKAPFSKANSGYLVIYIFKMPSDCDIFIKIAIKCTNNLPYIDTI